jgi:hygromycin-B 7''-O-kinase
MGQIHEYYFQPNAADPVLSEVEVLRCVGKFVSGVRTVTHVEESGGEARTYIVDHEIVLKVQRPQQVRVSTSLAKEVFYLNQLAAHDSTLPVPHVLGYARESNLLEYTIQTRMPGIAFANADLSPEARRDAIFAVGQLLRRIHALPPEPFHSSAHFPTDHTADDFRIRLVDYFEYMGQRIKSEGRNWPLDLYLEKITEHTLAALPKSFDAVAVHANPGPPHVFVDSTTGKFTGLIDFGDAYISHPVMDVWRWRTPADRPHALAGYTADAAVSDDFLQVWKCVSIVGDVVLIGYFPDRVSEAVDDLQILLKEVF